VRSLRGVPAIVLNIESRRDPELMPLKTAELLNHLQHFENARLER
jgi:hypothetical protein